MTPLIRTFAAGIVIGVALQAAGPLSAAPNAAVEGVTDGGLRGQIELAIGEAKASPRSALEARRRAVDAARDAIALLRSEGYYEGTATPDIAKLPTIRSVVRVAAGRRFKLAPATIDWALTPPDAEAEAAALSALHLPAGAPGRAADVLAGEGSAIATLKRRGYADAEVRPREVIVDHADATVKPTFRIAAGDRVKLGSIRRLGKDRTRESWIARLAPWKAGDFYDPNLLAEMEKRLLDTGVYDAATVALAPADGPKGDPRSVTVSLIGRPRRALELGAGYSTTEGSGVDGKWTFYNRLGRGDSLTLTAKLYDIQQKLDLEQDLPHWLRAGQTLKIGGGFLGDRTPAYDDIGGGLRLDVIRKFNPTNLVSVGGSVDFASTREKVAVNLLATPIGQDLKLLIVTTRVAFALDRTNSILDPSRGWRLEAEADPTLIEGDRSLGYLRSQVQLSGYLPLGRGFPVVAARVKVGSILGGSIPEVPADRRFYAGGGGSVRGYAYQAVGPRLSDNTPQGGLSVTEGSVELRQRVSRNWGVVAFADVGTIGASASPTYDGLAVGVGAGIRYDLGFGPLRLDIATPINSRRGDSPVQVYISIGQAF